MLIFVARLGWAGRLCIIVIGLAEISMCISVSARSGRMGEGRGERAEGRPFIEVTVGEVHLTDSQITPKNYQVMVVLQGAAPCVC